MLEGAKSNLMLTFTAVSRVGNNLVLARHYQLHISEIITTVADSWHPLVKGPDIIKRNRNTS